MSMSALRTVYYVVHVWTEIETRLEITSAPPIQLSTVCALCTYARFNDNFISQLSGRYAVVIPVAMTPYFYIKKKLQAKAS